MSVRRVRHPRSRHREIDQPSGRAVSFIEAKAEWRGETAAILASGPSLAKEDLGLLRGMRTIVLNDSAYAYPEADILLLCDKHWTPAHPDLSFYKGPLIICLRPDTVAKPDPRMVAMRRGPHDGISMNRAELNGQCTAVSHAVNLAVHRGVKRILLVGVDLRSGPRGERHYHQPNLDTQNATYRYAKMAISLATQAAPLKRMGIEVINCSVTSLLKCYPKQKLADVVALA